MPKQSDLPPTLLHFDTPPSDNCVGYAHLFNVHNICTKDPVCINHQLIYERISPTSLDKSLVYFMNCPNHVNYDFVAQGTITIIHHTVTNLYLLGFILAFGTHLTIALCHDTSCFFEEYVYEPQHYFRSVRSFSFDDIFQHHIKLYYINQLSQFCPFRDHLPDYVPSWLISYHDNKINSSPLGPDKFLYEQYEADALMKFCINLSVTSSVKSNVKCIINESTSHQSSLKPKRSSRSRGRSRRGLLTLHPSNDRLKQAYTSYDFGTPILSPSDRFAIPFCNLLHKINHHGISHRKFAFVNQSQLRQIMIICNNMHIDNFDKHLSKYPTITFPVVDPIHAPTDDIAIIKSYPTTTHSPIIKLEQGEFSSLTDRSSLILSYWHLDEMKVCEKVDMCMLIKMFVHAFGCYHHGRKCTVGEGLNVYDGQVGGQSWAQTCV